MLFEVEDKLAKLISRYIFDPLGFVKKVFPWGKGLLKDEIGLEDWQAEFLAGLGKHLRESKGEPFYFAVSSGHDVGKTALVAWLILWFQSTHPHPQNPVTANTKTQLETKTWRELAKWHKLALNSHWFEWTASKFYLKTHPETWFASAIPWSKERSEAFAGTHEKYVMLIFDEASAIDDDIWQVASGAMLDPGAIWIVLGNPTRNTGRFKECFPGGKFAHRWKHMRVDARNVRRSNKNQINEWIEDYGEDSDFVRIRVKGIHPRTSSTQFIPEDLVENAMNAHMIPGLFDHAPILIGVDVARFGDDISAILVRQGGIIKKLRKFMQIDTMQLVGHVTEDIMEFDPAATFVDVVGLGAGVCDRLKQLGFDIIEVNAGERALEEKLYHNLRAEMWGNMKKWLKTAYLPRDDQLKADLTGLEYGFDDKNRFQLEKKEDMKKRGLSSPNCFVAGTLVETVGGPVPIEKIPIGERVITPFGPSSVIAIHKNDTDRLTTAHFSNGSFLKGTGNHEIFTFSSCKSRLDALTLTDEIEILSRWRLTLWRIVRLFSIAGRDTDFKQKVDTLCQTNICRKDFYTGGYGSIIMGLFQRALKSITRIVTPKIIPSKILNFAMSDNTVKLTYWIGQETPMYAKNGLKPCLKEERRPPNGMDHRTELPGTKNTGNKVGSEENRSMQSASGAEKYTNLISRQGHVSVHLHVNRPLPSADILRISASVLTAARNLWQIVTGRQLVVPVSVQTENVPRTPTYNLTLAEHNVYYANGILVFNCADALGLTFVLPVSADSKKKDRDYRQLYEIYGPPRASA